VIIVTLENNFWKNLNKNHSGIPLILVDDESCLYYLVKDLHEELEKFIRTGKTQVKEFHVFPEEEELEMARQWENLGLTVTYHSQQLWYMSCRFKVTYLKVSSPDNGMSISLVPWFVLPGRPFPVFVYIYAIRHYKISGEKSLSKSAAATAKVFGIDSFNKSTVSRNIKALENFADITRIDRPLAVEGSEAPSDATGATDTNDATGATDTDAGDDGAALAETIGLIAEIVKNCPPLKSLEEEYGKRVKQLPKPINSATAARRALAGIPGEFFKVIKESPPFSGISRDTRKRPARPRPEGPKCVQRPLRFVESWKIEKERKDFIKICRHIVLDAAAAYHRFLI